MGVLGIPDGARMNTLQHTMSAVFAGVAAGILTYWLLEWTKSLPEEFRLPVTIGVAGLAFLTSWLLLPRSSSRRNRVVAGIRAKGDVTLTGIHVSGPSNGCVVASDIESDGDVKVSGVMVGETASRN